MGVPHPMKQKIADEIIATLRGLKGVVNATLQTGECIIFCLSNLG